MSKYHAMEAGAVPGYRDGKTGPVTIYSIGLSGGTSRALNRSEADERLREIEEWVDEEKSKIHEEAATRLRALIADWLGEFKLDNHIIILDASCGTSQFYITSRHTLKRYELDDYRLHDSPLLDRLREIDQMLEGMWDYTCHMSGWVLNP